MRHYFIFLKKELLESIRTYKLFIMLIVFSVFGVISPLIAKLTPFLMKQLASTGIQISIPDPTAFDAWAQFFKNTSQMGLILLIIIFSGILTSELSKGTLIPVLTKGLSRKAVILSKFSVAVLIWTLSLTISALITWMYTLYLFPTDNIHHLVFSIFCLWFFGVFLLSLLIFSSTIIKATYGNLIVVILIVVIGMVLNIIPSIQTLNPIGLFTQNMDLITGSLNPTYFISMILITLTIVVMLLSLSIIIFNKREMN